MFSNNLYVGHPCEQKDGEPVGKSDTAAGHTDE